MATYTATLYFGDETKNSLRINGYRLQHCTFGFYQNANTQGAAYGKVMSGQILMVLVDPADNNLIKWASDQNMQKSGRIVFEESNHDLQHLQTVEFKEAYCTMLENTFDGGAQAGAYHSSLQIVCASMDVYGENHYNASWNEQSAKK